MDRGPKSVSHDAPPIRGYAWHLYPDPARGMPADDAPFPESELPGDEGGVAAPPEGVTHFWKLNRNTPGIANSTDGTTYLVLTDRAEPPAMLPGWFAEEARLDDSFHLDQRGHRWVRLIRKVGAVDTPSGSVRLCEFQVDRG